MEKKERKLKKILAARENEVFLQKKKRRKERDKRRTKDKIQDKKICIISKIFRSPSSSSIKESRKKDKMHLSSSNKKEDVVKQATKKDTKPPSNFSKTKREDF